MPENNRPSGEDWLRAALHEAAEQTHPSDRLDEIRSRTARHGRVSARQRRWAYPVMASGAVAACLLTVTLLGPRLFNGSDTTPPIGAETASDSPHGSTSTPSQPRVDPATPVYYALDSGPERSTSWAPTQPLVREFHRDASGDRMGSAVQQLSATPADPDYRTYVPAGIVSTAQVVDGTLRIEIADPDATQRPPELSATQARTAVLQIVYTTRAAAGQARLPVEFEIDGTALPRVLGVAVDKAIALPDREAMAPIALTTPENGAPVSDELRLTGRGFDLQGGWIWEVSDDTGAVVGSGSGKENQSGRGVQTFEESVVTDRWTPGDYLVSVRVRDPRTAQVLPWSDSRQFTIR